MADSKVTFLSSSGVNPMQALEDALKAQPSEEAMLYAGARQITRIRERTAQGLDVNGAPFTPYTKAYAKVRTKKGRNVTPVDLLMSGRLMDSLQVEVRSETEFAITVQDADAAIYGRAHNEGLGNLPQRRFFDTSADEIAEMQKDVFTFDRVTRK
jgi:hypothetical protein